MRTLREAEETIIAMEEGGYHKDAAKLRRLTEQLKTTYHVMGLSLPMRLSELRRMEELLKNDSGPAARMLQRKVREELNQWGYSFEKQDKVVKKLPVTLAVVLSLMITTVAISSPGLFAFLPIVWVSCLGLHMFIRFFESMHKKK